MMRRLLPIAALTVLPAVALTGCGSSGQKASSKPSSAATAAGVVTPASARKVLSQFTAVNNRSNKLREASLLATYEGGSSYQIDQGYYRWTRVTDPANKSYVTDSYADPVYYIPRQSSYPAWFVARTVLQQAKSSSSQDVYLIFAKASAGANWMEVLEPGTSGLPAQAAPPVATDASGYATQVSPADATGLKLAPAALPAKDVTYLDVDNIPTTAPRPGLPKPKRPTVVNFANGKDSLGDLSDKKFWHSHLPAGSTDLDQHQATADPVYALRTANGGALVFYDLTASLTLGVPDAQTFAITIPGIFNGKEQARSFQVNYGDQFAVYEPPGPSGVPTVLANDSGPESGECDGGPCG